MTLEEYAKKITDCTTCGLCKTRKSVIIGEGDPSAAVMILGACPSIIDDTANRVFSDEYGKWTRAKLRLAGFLPGQAYLSYAVKCFPADVNPFGVRTFRMPTAFEFMSCRSLLLDHISAIQPKMIITLGSPAFDIFRTMGISEKRKMASYRGDRYDFYIGSLKMFVVPTLHPQFVVQSRSKLRENEFLKDLKRVHEFIFAGKDWLHG